MIAEIVISALLVLGGLFGLVGSFGLLKLNDPMKRLHGPTKATTVGVGATLVASVLYFKLVQGLVTWQELLIVVFLFITSPVTALFLAKAHLHRNMKPSDLPPTGTARGWATFDGDPGDRDARHL
ncbi:Na+/H+ antiporter subunit G [Tabrizicola sp. J26]|uniref:Na+/H+ antiporter subunit G n=1 Tax=Alitabrizicola rongguiensis TaxID=2909234 RepID=UPI001F23B330|nr:Na+/H+ antiporter subunit G [Tabrizicola rongguiensis]MCF1707429.1 Na+/H+ antiporter subunit G [Tabrizicola rongguiensis]